jgi:hypothetical protein
MLLLVWPDLLEFPQKGRIAAAIGAATLQACA